MGGVYTPPHARLLSLPLALTAFLLAAGVLYRHHWPRWRSKGRLDVFNSTPPVVRLSSDAIDVGLYWPI